MTSLSIRTVRYDIYYTVVCMLYVVWLAYSFTYRHYDICFFPVYLQYGMLLYTVCLCAICDVASV